MGLCTSKATEAAKQSPQTPEPRSNRRPSVKTKPVSRRVQDFYVMSEVLGEGSFSVVKLATNITTQEKVAAKIVNRARLRPQDDEGLMREVEILRRINHPNIVKLIDFFDDSTFYYLVMEYVPGGELFHHLAKKEVYTENEARDIAEVIFNTLKYLHDRDLVHRDLKPENILLVDKNDIRSLKLADFGFAIQQAEDVTTTHRVGTPGYVSPEVLEYRPHGKPVDMWAMGVILYMLLGGYPPFYDPSNNQKLINRRICNGEFEFHNEYWGQVSSEAKQLIKGLLTVDVTKRMTVDQALSHPWLSKPSIELSSIQLNQQGVLSTYLAGGPLKFNEFASVAIDAMRKLSGANLLQKPGVLNDVAIDVARKISSTTIEAVRKRSAASISSNSSVKNNQRSSVSTKTDLNSNGINNRRASTPAAFFFAGSNKGTAQSNEGTSSKLTEAPDYQI